MCVLTIVLIIVDTMNKDLQSLVTGLDILFRFTVAGRDGICAMNRDCKGEDATKKSFKECGNGKKLDKKLGDLGIHRRYGDGNDDVGTFELSLFEGS
jgi:hypothetical protein